MYFNYVLNTKVIQHEQQWGALKSIRWYFYNMSRYTAQHTKSFIQTKEYKKEEKKNKQKNLISLYTLLTAPSAETNYRTTPLSKAIGTCYTCTWTWKCISFFFLLSSFCMCTSRYTYIIRTYTWHKRSTRTSFTHIRLRESSLILWCAVHNTSSACWAGATSTHSSNWKGI